MSARAVTVTLVIFITHHTHVVMAEMVKPILDPLPHLQFTYY
jgi:hypothetical protein